MHAGGGRTCGPCPVWALTVFVARTPRYTLGGFYLARYDDSPAGSFNEVGGPSS